MKGKLLTLAILAGSIATLHAQSFWQPVPVYLEPAWRGDAGTEYSAWDVFYSPYAGINYPDIEAPNGAGDFASSAGFTPPANANPSDPFAFWHVANPTVTQVLLPTAFIVNPGADGNIYSPGGTTGYEVADATPFTAGTVVVQWQTDGTLIDFDTLRLVKLDGTEIAPTNFITEHKSSGSAFGGLFNRTAAQWNLTGLGVTSYTIKFTAEGSSTSMQQMLLDTAPTYVEAVQSARSWSVANGGWSGGANWSGGTVGPVGGNIVIAGGSSLTVDGGTREIGELKLTAPGAFAIGASGGGILKVNTGITATPAAPANYLITAPYENGSYNLMEIGAGTTVELAGSVSGTAGYLKIGAGTLHLSANNTFAGGIGLDEGTLIVSGMNQYAGSTGIISGQLVLRGAAPSGAAGTLGNASSSVVVGADPAINSPQPEAALVIDGNHTVGRNVFFSLGNNPKTLAARSTTTGALFSGIVNLASTADNISLRAESATDTLTFSGDIRNGGAGKTLSKTGPGTVVFSGANKTYLNNTIVSEGTLRFASGTAMNGNGSVTVESGAQLIVHGSLNGSGPLAINGGTLGGSGIIARNTTIAAGGRLEFSLGTLAANHDKLDLAAGKSLTFSGASTLTITRSGGVAPGAYTLLTAPGGITGSAPATLVLPSGWAGSVAKSGNDLVFTLTSIGTPIFADWQLVNATAGTFNADHDNDGVPNGVEFFLEGNNNTTGQTALPSVVNTGGVLKITWVKSAAFVGTYGTHFAVETNTALGGAWTTETLGVNVTLTGNTLTYTFPTPLGAGRFARLRVEQP